MFGSSSGSQNATALQGVQINSSNYGKPLPICYGTNRMSSNVLYYNDFVAQAQSAGGKGGGGGASSYAYFAAIMLAICEGPILGINNIYKNRAPLPNPDIHGNTPLQQESLTISLGTQTQLPWSYVTANHPADARSNAGTAWIANSNMALDGNAGIPQYNVEVQGLYQVGGGNVDANPRDFIADLLGNPRYGAGFPASSLSDLSDYGNYCTAAGFFFSPVLDQQQQVQQYLTDWALWSNSEIVWSQGKLKYIPYGDQTLVGNGVTWIPSLGIVYNLNDDNYLDQGGSDPLTVSRTSPSDAYNDMQLEFLDRSNNYNAAVAEAMDQGAIDIYGLRTQSATTAHGICVASIAQLSVQLQLQRGLYIRNTYHFSLPVNFCLLEPMDLVAITDQTLGYNAMTVRVTEVEEADDMSLKVTCEDFILGIGTSLVNQATQANQSNAVPQSANPGNVSTPQFFNMPSALVAGNSPGLMGVSPTSTLQLGVAVAGTDQNWGGCQVWVSLDGTTYKQYTTVLRGASAANKLQGTSTKAARFGLLTADYPLHADPDAADTLSVDLSSSLGILQSATAAQAAAAATICLLGGTECVSYTTATLTTGYNYNCTGTIRRGQARTPISDHPIGSSFIRLDDGIVKYNYLPEQIGQTIHLKFLSFNLFGNNVQSLADVTDYTVTLTPASAIPSPITGLALVGSFVGTQFTVAWNPSLSATSYTVQIYKSDGTTLLRSTTVVTSTGYTYTRENAITDGDLERTYVVKVIANSPAGSSAAVSLTVTNSPPPAVTGLTSSGSTGTTINVGWGVPADPDVAGYVAYYSTSPGFTPPGAGTQFYSGIATAVKLPGLTPATTYYMRVAAYDAWSSDPTALVFSAQYTFTT